jgi:hypothetical protein
MGAPSSTNECGSKKTGDPDFLPRCTGQDYVCAFPRRKADALYQRHDVRQEIRGKPIQCFWSFNGTVVH